MPPTVNPIQKAQAIATYQDQIRNLERQQPSRARQRAVAHLQSLIDELEEARENTPQNSQY